MQTESERGNVEYKLRLSDVSPDQFDRIITQLKYRLDEGLGEAIYELGVSDNGEFVGMTSVEKSISLDTLAAASSKLNAEATVIREVDGRMGKMVEVLIRKTRKADAFPIWLYIPVLGNVDSGKSTMVGVLTTGKLDKGNGEAMARVARFLHEIKTHKTSSISSHAFGFVADGTITNYGLQSPLDEAEIFLGSSKIIDFVDLGGHERYFKTTLRGITGHQPDYCIITVAANAGIMPMTIEHLKVVLGLKLPIIFVVTKIDMTPQLVPNVIEHIQSMVKLPKINAIPFVIRSREDIVPAVKAMASGRVIPIFTVSNVTGAGLDLFKSFLNLLPQRNKWYENMQKDFCLSIDEKYNVRGVGLVVSGLIRQGIVSVNDGLLLGPFSDGSFRNVRAKTIHVNRTFVNKSIAGSDTCLALGGVDYKEIRKGMSLLGVNSNPKAVHKFDADVFILHHPTTIREGYQTVVHSSTIRQSARFEHIYGTSLLRTGDKAKVTLQFLFEPEFLLEDQTFVFRDSSAKGIGVVTKILQ